MRNDGNRSLSAIMVIFGGTGDLTHRKLMPALYNLVYDKLLPDNFAVVSIGRRDKTNEQYREEVFESLNKYSRNKIDREYWARLKDLIYYIQFDFTEQEGYQKLKNFLKKLDEKYNTGGNRIFYLAVAPEYFELIVQGISDHGLTNQNGSWTRLVIEKPFGKDLKTARKLNEKLLEVFDESSIYRIDHYLGKEMIQNIMVLRFCNTVFESLWSNKYIDNVQISLSEKNGVGTRGGYYESSGAMRDMVQNHIVQILSLVAMEPPVNLKTESIRTEKLKVIQAIEDFTGDVLRKNVVFGQYGKGVIDGRTVVSYREEPNIPAKSTTETFVALKLHINNFRWAGTPFYIRTGKRMGKTSSEIVIQFKELPEILYFKEGHVQVPNLLVIRIQPNVGVFFQFNTKDFSTHNDIVSTKMDTSYYNPTAGNTPEAYERLIYDILRGDATLFSRWDEVEASWIFADKIIEYRVQKKFDFPNYDAGTMGPVKAFELLAMDGRKWWDV
ncbi:MAG: glucose-6-phosphate dehydrogenase [Acetivibrionales bacterium]|jgi:glucose-6-phosphate 1-dehydrogenase